MIISVFPARDFLSLFKEGDQVSLFPGVRVSCSLDDSKIVVMCWVRQKFNYVPSPNQVLGNIIRP